MMDGLMTRRVRMDPNRHRFHNKAALVLTLLTLMLLVSLSLLFGDRTTGYSSSWESSSSSSSWSLSSSGARWLENHDDDSSSGGGNNEDDYSRFSCRYIYEKVPDHGYSQCRFARTCNGGEGVWAPFVFCQKKLSTVTIFVALSPFLVLWMITLFRMLGSTAEDYFSPALEMFSVKLGLPPRFAGVTLLALGNGAADVSATMSAIVNDEENGYKLSLGALTGAAMLVGGVVSGIVVLVAGGVPCRGALVRDVLALFVTIFVVWWELSKGEIGPSSITLFLSLYVLFVCLVLVADIYHRAVVIPRLAAAGHVGEGALDEQVGGLNTDLGPCPPSALSRVITAFSNYDNDTPCNQENNDEAASEGWGISSQPDPQGQDADTPIVLHGIHGILHGDGLGHAANPRQTVTAPDEGGNYTLVEDQIDQFCAREGSPGFSSTNWRGAWHDGQQEIHAHIKEVWEDIAYNGDLNAGEKMLMLCELPFTFLRKATICIPCEGYYNRGVIALSMALSPLWFAYYIWAEHEVNLFARDGVIFFFIFWGITICMAAMVLRFAPGGEGHMAMGVAAPIALYGFAMAATWIDFIADHLVALLDFMGIVLHIPGSVMGLTVLAWGNSMGDLSANMTMARKGLANMAMTACFAGPVFNILLGLGFGFSSLTARTGKSESAVSLSPPIITGFVFVLVNCASILVTGLLLGKGRIETYYGYIALGLYTTYVITSITLQFSRYGDANN